MLNKSFFKFFFGFMFIVAMSFSVIVLANYFEGDYKKIESDVVISD